MYYVLIVEGKAHENILEFDPVLPSVPIEERYAPEFLAQCITSDEEIPHGWIYDSETGAFSEPPPPPEPETLPEPGTEEPHPNTPPPGGDPLADALNNLAEVLKNAPSESDLTDIQLSLTEMYEAITGGTT